MKTLIVYDNSGKIWNQMSGTYDVPNGLPYLEVEIPEGKYPVSVDVSGAEPVVVYDSYPVPTEQMNRADIDYLAMMIGVEL